MLRRTHLTGSALTLLVAAAAGTLGCSSESADDVTGDEAAAIACASSADWKESVTYATGSVVTYAGKSYQCRQGHTSLPGWTPEAVLALWEPVSCDGITPPVVDPPPPTKPVDPPPPTKPVDPPPVGGKKLIGYYPAWATYGRNFQVADVAVEKLTHLNYGFANIANGECVIGDSYADAEKSFPGDTWDQPLRGNFNQFQKLKQRNASLKTLISVGGWTWSDGFAAAASTPAAREKFATSCVRFMKKYGFDGIDIDWEFPGGGGLAQGSPADKPNFTLLLGELRKQLESQGSADGGAHYLLTVAVSPGASKIASIETDKIHQYLDFINVMTYDFHGGWETRTGFNAPLYQVANDPSADKATFFIDAAINNWLTNVPASKLVMGVPFYARGWTGVPNVGNGLFQSATGPAPSKFEAGVFDYKELAGLSGFTRYFSDEAKVPWLYNPSTGVMISYDDPESIGIKADYLNQKGLAGAMFWEASGDDASHSLLNTLAAKLGR